MAEPRSARRSTGLTGVLRALGVAGLVGLSGFHALFTLGAGGLIVPRCHDPFGTCLVIGLQAALALLATCTFGVAAYRLVAARPTAGIVFAGTLPFWLFHIPLKIFDPNEGTIFVVAPAFAPLIAGGVWLVRRRLRRGPLRGEPRLIGSDV
jgi:hypothetical protein